MSVQIWKSLLLLTALFLVAGCDADEEGVIRGRMREAVEESGPVRLSAGVALPQTLPSGTAVMFSVDYLFVGVKPDPDAAYFWEIRRGDGKIQQIAVEISKIRGNLHLFLPIRPEAGPFQSRITLAEAADAEPTPLTDWVEMK